VLQALGFGHARCRSFIFLTVPQVTHRQQPHRLLSVLVVAVDRLLHNPEPILRATNRQPFTRQSCWHPYTRPLFLRSSSCERFHELLWTTTLSV